MDSILTIDTEGDNQWDHGRKLTVDNIKFIPRFQELCNKYLIKPTYLVTSEICDDCFAKDFFTDCQSRRIEIGAHLHAWTTPPFKDKDGYRYNDPNHAFATEFSEDLLAEKIKYLTNQIEISFGKRPVSFRSGRYGFDENVAKILAANSYLVDSSVTPYTNWSDHQGMPGGKGGPDFLDCTPFPYKINSTSGNLIEIPITILPTSFPLNKSKKIAKNYFKNVDDSILLRMIRKLLFQNQPLWLRPYPWMEINSFETLISSAQEIRLPHIVMMFHSSELMPGCSIYRQDKYAIEKLYNLLEQFFVLLHENNIVSITLSEAATNYKVYN